MALFFHLRLLKKFNLAKLSAQEANTDEGSVQSTVSSKL